MPTSSRSTARDVRYGKKWAIHSARRCQCFMCFTGQFDENEIGFGIQVLFLGFVYDSQISLMSRFFVRQD